MCRARQICVSTGNKFPVVLDQPDENRLLFQTFDPAFIPVRHLNANEDAGDDNDEAESGGEPVLRLYVFGDAAEDYGVALATSWTTPSA